MYKKLLYTVDISEVGSNNINKAAAFAKTHNADICILHVIRPVRLSYCYAEEMMDYKIEKDLKKNATIVLNKMFGELNKIPFKIIFGKITESILKYSDDNNFDAILLDGHIHNIFGRLGSVADRVINNAKQDVIVLR